MSALLEVRGARRYFGGVRAVDDVDLDVAAGEVLGLVGHNGAGKSTLVRALSGADPLDAGEIRVADRAAPIRSPRDARALGIETIYQDLALADELDAVANLFLGRERTSRLGVLDEDAMERDASAVLARVSPELTALRTPVRRLSGGQRQAVAVARALLFDARVLIMDEPTAALGPGETAAVASVIRRLRDQGLGILVVSHDLHDVFELSDRIAVMRRGRLITTTPKTQTTPETILRQMLTGTTNA